MLSRVRSVSELACARIEGSRVIDVSPIGDMSKSKPDHTPGSLVLTDVCTHLPTQGWISSSKILGKPPR